MKQIQQFLNKPMPINEVVTNDWIIDTTEICEKHGEYISSIKRGLESRAIPDCPKCRQERELRSKLGGKDGIAKRFTRCSFDNYEVNHESQAQIKDILESFARDFEDHLEMGTPVLLLGGVGTGKTHLACSIANEIADRGYNSIFRSVSALIRSIRDCWGRNGEEAKLIELYKNIDLLIIDEVGVQAGSDNERNILFDIINGRYEEMKPTIMISNLKIEDFTKAVGQRIASRIQHEGLLLPFAWRDYRAAQGAQR